MKKLLIAFLIAAAIPTTAHAKEPKISQEYVNICREVAYEYCLPPELLIAIIERESGGKANATGDDGKAVGLMQIHECYQHERMERLGVASLYDPKANVTVGAEIICELLYRYDDPRMMLQKYNGVSDAEWRAKTGNWSEYAVWVTNRVNELQEGQ